MKKAAVVLITAILILSVFSSVVTAAKDDVAKPLEIGDVLVRLPDYTTENTSLISDESLLSEGIAAIEWYPIDGASKYTVRIFKKVITNDGIAYQLQTEASTSGTSLTFSSLPLNTQYAIVVYAYDSSDTEIAVFDYLNASTASNIVSSKPTTVTSEEPTSSIVNNENEELSSSGKSSTGSSRRSRDDEEPQQDDNHTLLVVLVIALFVVTSVSVTVTVIIAKKQKNN